MDINAFIAGYIAANNLAFSDVIADKIVNDNPDILLEASYNSIRNSIVVSLPGILTTSMLADAKWIKDQIVDDRYRQFPVTDEGNKGYYQAIADRDKKLKELGLFNL